MLSAQIRLGTGTLVVLAACLTSGCSDAVSAPPSDLPLSVEALTPVSLVGFARGAVSQTPAVVVRDRGGAALVGVTVHFTVTSGGGQIANRAATTDAQGIASCGAWILGTIAGQNSLLASVEGAGGVVFVAESRRAITGTERFDLQTIAGRALPIRYSSGAISWEVIRGHYLFGENGTVALSHVVHRDILGYAPEDSTVMTGVWTVHGTTPTGTVLSVAIPGGPSGTVLLEGDRLSTRYASSPQWEDAVYLRVLGSLPKAPLPEPY